MYKKNTYFLRLVEGREGGAVKKAQYQLQLTTSDSAVGDRQGLG